MAEITHREFFNYREDNNNVPDTWSALWTAQ